MSKIEWTEKTWNPVTGCKKVTPGCKHCYAESMSIRLQAMGAPGYENGFNVSLLHERLDQPRQRRKPTKYFVNSMGDLFQEDVPFTFVDQVMTAIRDTPQHTHQILTKRSSNASLVIKKRAIQLFLHSGTELSKWGILIPFDKGRGAMGKTRATKVACAPGVESSKKTSTETIDIR